MLKTTIFICVFVFVNFPACARFMSVDPEREFVSGYVYGGNDAVNGLDPNGREWFEIVGKWVFFENTPELDVIQFKGFGESSFPVFDVERLVGVDELVSFNGSEIAFRTKAGGHLSFPGVAGKLSPSGATQPDKQWIPDVGPIPEGWYHINPADIQYWDDLDKYQKAAAYFKKGPWPFGTPAWGEIRVPIKPGKVKGPDGTVRTNFFIHGGMDPGTRGCIDLCDSNDTFFEFFKFLNRPFKMKVSYPQNPKQPSW